MKHRLIALCAAALCAFAAPAVAGIVNLEEAQRRAEERLAEEVAQRRLKLAPIYDAIELYRTAAAEFVPGLVEPLIDYGTVETRPPACVPGRDASTHAILVGSGRKLGMDISELAGPANDVELLAGLLTQLGVDAANIHVVLNKQADRAGVRSVMLDVLAKAGCDDRVILHFSTRSLRPHEFLTQFVLQDERYEDAWQGLEASLLGYQQLVEAIRTEKPAFDDGQSAFVETVFGGRFDNVGLMLDDESAESHEIMLGRDISDYAVAVRNRGAHAVISLDILFAASADIKARQAVAEDQAGWSFEFSREETVSEANAGGTLLPGHGDFAVFYAGGVNEMTPELRLPRDDPDAKVFGLFTFHLANALLAEPMSTPRSMAESIRRSYLAEQPMRSHPRIDASNPDLVLVAEALGAQAGEGAIRILSPTPKRGAMAVERPEIEIEGIVEWPSRTLGVHIDQQPAIVDGEGRFRGKAQLRNGLNRVNVIAVTADSRLHPYTLEFVYEGDRNALEGEGRRIAVIIANQTYGGDTGFASLATPFSDADALAEVLTRKYGFETRIPIGGTELSLLLKDQTGDAIQRALHAVGKAVGEKDTVLVYYAGHGIYEPVTSTAYWVPSDAEVGFEPSYLSADDIDKAIRRMQAGSVILISDSCYSGALIRGGAAGDAETVKPDERIQALLRMQSRRSRVIVTSGNNEPVEDLGGQGHSVFARALLTGLEKMEHDAFSARELFDGYILQAVTANADQEPQYRPLEKVGHEGGDFVFVRSGVETAIGR